MHRNRRSRAFSCLPAVLCFALSPGCGEKNVYQPPPPPEVTVSRPIAKTIQRTLQFTGTTSPIEIVEIRARVKGFLEEVRFTDGAEVAKGDVLYVIDPKPFETTKRQAEAALLLAEARVKTAEADYLRAKVEAQNADAQLSRGERAARGGAVTQAELDDLRTERSAAYARAAATQATIGSAQAEVEAAKAQIAQADLDLGYATVQAPIAGRVGETEVDVGNLVGASEPTLLTRIVRYSPIYAYYTISEADLLQWIEWKREGKDYTSPAKVATQEFPIRLGLANEEGYPHEGVFDYADLAVDQSSGTFRVRGRFDNEQREIPPGAFVRVEVPLEAEEVLLVNERAIGRDQGGSYALVVVEKDGQDKVERRPVELAEAHERMRIVLTGLTTDDRVIVNGLQRARPGSVVKVTEQSPATEVPPQEPPE